MRTIDRSSRSLSLGAVGVAAALVQGALFPAGEAQAQATCARTITANRVLTDAMQCTVA
jgi:hypothetical protein